MKKPIVFVAAAALVVILSSCGGDGGAVSGTESDAAAVTTVTEPASEAQETAIPVVNEIYEEPEILSGEFSFRTGVVVAGKGDGEKIALCGNYNAGGLSTTVRVPQTGSNGMVFMYSVDNGRAKGYVFALTKTETSYHVDLYRIQGTRMIEKGSHYASASITESSEKAYKLRVVESEGKYYCYFFNTLHYIIDVNLGGTEFGYYSTEKSGSTFTPFKLLEKDTPDQCDTIIMGHSYMEGWNDWKSDMRSLRSECGIGSTLNVAISGSVAQHWLDLANEVAVYNPKVALFWIGTNDLMNPSKTPAQYCKTVEDTLVKLKKLLPEFRCVLLNCCRCEKRSSVEDKIAAYNKCYEELAEKYDWIILVDTEYMFCNSAGKPLASWFKDGLHPNADAFKKKVIPAIKEAILASDGKES